MRAVLSALMVLGLVGVPGAPALAAGIPTVTATSGATVWAQGGAAVAVDAGLTLANFDTISGATVTIQGGFIGSEDRLNFATQSGITGNYNSGTGVLTLSGSASAAAYEAALRSVTYQNAAGNPTAQARSITFSIGGNTLYFQGTGHYYEYVAAQGISWTNSKSAAEARALYGLHGYLATITSGAENGFAASKLQGNGWIGASDAGQEGVWRWVTGPEAGTQFSNQYVSNACNAYGTGIGVNGQYANWHSAEPNNCGNIENYAHFYSSDGTWNDFPDNNGGVAGYVVEYGGMPGDAAPVLSASKTVNVVRIPPSVTATSGATVWTQGGAAVAVDNGLTLANFDSVSGATVTIQGGFVAGEDQLNFVSQSGISGSYNAATGVLTLSGTASSAAYQAALRSVTYRDTAAIPNGQPRTITFAVGGSALYYQGTGHYYEYVPVRLTWPQAKAAAEARTLYGLHGYLVTITSQAENDFAASKVQGWGWIGASDEQVEGQWRWMTGPEAGTLFSNQLISGPCNPYGTGQGVNGQYANWDNRQPDDCNEDYAHFLANGHWNDLPVNYSGIQGYVVEYGGMPGDATPVLSASKTVNLQVYPQAKAGALASTQSSYTFPIAYTVANGPAQGVNLYVSSNGGTTWQQAGGTYTSSPISYTAPANGTYAFSVQAMGSPLSEPVPNGAASVEATTQVRVVPTVSIAQPTAGSFNDKTVTVTGTATPGSQVNLYLDNPGQNIALGKPATMSSGWNGNQYPAANCVDGTANMCHTWLNPGEWWRVDLLSAQNISEIRVYNRVDCCQDRADRLQLQTSNDGSTWTTVASNPGRFGGSLTGATNMGAPWSVTQNLSPARYVRMYQPIANHINIAEVQVYIPGTPDAVVTAGADGSYSYTFSGLTGGDHTLRAVADLQGVQSTPATVTFQVDALGPVVTTTRTPANANGWNKEAVTVNFACTDAGAGMGTCPDPVTVATEGQNQTATAVAADKYGNTTTAAVYGINIDLTVPTITGLVYETANAAGWYKAPVAVTFTCTDALSGVQQCSDPVTLASEGAGQQVTGNVSDKAGNTATTDVTGINIDLTAPTTTVAAPTGWQKADVTLTLTAQDGLSGVAATHYQVDGDAEQQGTAVTLTADGTHTVTYYSVDKAGNAEASQSVTVQIDKTLPTISGAVDGTPNANGWFNGAVQVTFVCADGVSGVSSCTAPVTVSAEGQGQSATGTATDNAGNTASATVSGVNIDLTAPVTAVTSPAGWQKSDVTVSLTATDSLSGVASTSYQVDGGAATPGTSVTVSTEGTHTVAFGSVDKAGNAEPSQSVTVQIDKTLPTISGAVDRAANDAGWYGAAVQVNFTCGDALSGVDACTAPVTLGGEGAGQSASGTVTDKAGNSASATVTGIKIDLTAPATAASSPADWQKSDVTVSLSATDNLSGVASTHYQVDGGAAQDGTAVTISDEGTHTVSYWSVDLAGNQEAAKSLTVQIDKTAPTISGAVNRAANGAGWYNAAVTVSFTCDDQPSGVASCQSPVTVGGEGAGQSASGTVTDKAGNTASATVSGINIDLTAPATSATSPAGWQKSDVTVSLSVTDNLSGVASTHYQVDGGAAQDGTAVTLSAEGTHTVTYWSVDQAGNQEAAKNVTVQIDKTAPIISGAVGRPANAAGWYNSAVPVLFTCADAMSGVASCQPPVTVSGEGAGQSASGTVTDLAGNTASATVSGINIDLTSPMVSYTGNAGTYTVDQQVSIGCVATDGLSGVASSTCQDVQVAAYTLGLGQHGYNATAMDVAGNVGSGSTGFTVVVTHDSLCSLSQQFTGGKLGNSLCAKLNAAAASAAKGKEKTNNIDAFVKEVNAQTGKALTAEQADILIRLARSLSL